MQPAQAEEIRSALAAFRQSGKFVVAHLQNDGVRMGMPGYLAVAGASQVWTQASSEFMPMGLAAEVTFFGNTLQRYHMQAQFETREEFKTAAAELTDASFTPAHREELTGLMNGLYDSMLADIAVAAQPAEDVARPLRKLAKQAAAGVKHRRRRLQRAWETFRKAERFWRA
jgi:protease-4